MSALASALLFISGRIVAGVGVALLSAVILGFSRGDECWDFTGYVRLLLTGDVMEHAFFYESISSESRVIHLQEWRYLEFVDEIVRIKTRPNPVRSCCLSCVQIDFSYGRLRDTLLFPLAFGFRSARRRGANGSESLSPALQLTELKWTSRLDREKFAVSFERGSSARHKITVPVRGRLALQMLQTGQDTVTEDVSFEWKG